LSWTRRWIGWALNNPSILLQKMCEGACTDVQLKPRPDFDWNKLTWGRPDSPPSVLCSHCSAVIPTDAVPLMLWNDAGWAVRFCEKCMEKWWGFQ
jgi:hypothetical protein